MMKRVLMASLVAAAVGLLASGAWAGEPLVVKAGDGKFIPAAASEWAPAGEGAFRFVLKSGTSAQAVARELAPKLAPVQVEAPDDLTLVFRLAGLAEAELLARLSTLPLGGDAAMGDALAALGDLGSAGAPAMGDLSSAGSIRASKGFELPGAEDRKDSKANLVGEVIGLEPCQPMPLLHLRVVAAPGEGEHQAAFRVGATVAVRGYYKLNEDRKLDTSDERTQINLQAKEIKLGDRVYGKPFSREGDEWILETIEKL